MQYSSLLNIFIYQARYMLWQNFSLICQRLWELWPYKAEQQKDQFVQQTLGK